MADNQRIEDLRRRVQKDPASIAFAQLAEEHRRAGNLEESVAVARTGLEQHPAYLSARVTLGRALLELGRLDEAAVEFEHVVQAAPDNLTAVRQLADIQRRRQTSNAGEHTLASSAPQVPQVSAAPPVEAPRVEPVLPRVEPVTPTVQPVAEEGAIIAELEAWLAVLATDRASREGSSGSPAR
jgi:tetratricopeptide (TPR) repeat protein